MKKTVLILFLGVWIIASAISFDALAEPMGPPHGPSPHGPGFLGGPPGPAPGPPPHGPGHFGLLSAPPDLLEELKLTDDQIKQMRLTYVDYKDRTRKARNALMGLRDEAETMMVSGKIDLAKLAKLDEDTAKLASEVMGEELKMKREQLSKLTPEQMDRLADSLTRKKMPPHGPKPTGK